MPSEAFRRHLSGSDDLITPYAAVRAGFVAQALEKNRRATPFVEQARALKSVAVQAHTPADLLSFPEIQPALLTAAGVSDKAAGHLQPEDKAEAIQGLLKNFLEPAGAEFVEELVFRFLLTRGDTLGGSVRNIGGVLAQRKFTRAIISALRVNGIAYQWLHTFSNTWLPMPENDADIEIPLRGLSWQKLNGQARTLIYNLTVPLVGKNVDLCLLNCAAGILAPAIYREYALYLALGELKGGIDPAGADEHWKTARTALSRIRQAFSDVGLVPRLFFVGAAIEKQMAGEIWKQLEENALSNAANLTNADQLTSLIRWLCDL